MTDTARPEVRSTFDDVEAAADELYDELGLTTIRLEHGTGTQSQKRQLDIALAGLTAARSVRNPSWAEELDAQFRAVLAADPENPLTLRKFLVDLSALAYLWAEDIELTEYRELQDSIVRTESGLYEGARVTLVNGAEAVITGTKPNIDGTVSFLAETVAPHRFLHHGEPIEPDDEGRDCE